MYCIIMEIIKGIEIVDLGLLIDGNVLVLGDLHIGYEESLVKQGILAMADRHLQGDEAAETIGEDVGLTGKGEIVENAGNGVGKVVERTRFRRRGAKAGQIDHDQPPPVGDPLGQRLIGTAIAQERVDQNQIGPLTDDPQLTCRLEGGPRSL